MRQLGGDETRSLYLISDDRRLRLHHRPIRPQLHLPQQIKNQARIAHGIKITWPVSRLFTPNHQQLATLKLISPFYWCRESGHARCIDIYFTRPGDHAFAIRPGTIIGNYLPPPAIGKPKLRRLLAAEVLYFAARSYF